MNAKALVIKVADIKGKCPVYKVDDTILIEDGFRVNLKKTDNLCMHSLASIMPYYVALSRGVKPNKLGLTTRTGKAYIQCLDPVEYTGGGTVIFEIKAI